MKPIINLQPLRGRLFLSRIAAVTAVFVWLMLLQSAAAQGDYLTVEEAVRIQEAQDLLPRTEAYLGVVATRIAEIGRRTGTTYEIRVPGAKEKKPKKPKRGPGAPPPAEPENPLLFYQLTDLVQAISQSLRAVMTNIDERFQYQRAQTKEIVKSLTLLREFTSQNLSILDDLEAKARKDEDQLLYRAARNVREDLERAQGGAKEGLSVLEGPQAGSEKR